MPRTNTLARGYRTMKFECQILIEPGQTQKEAFESVKNQLKENHIIFSPECYQSVLPNRTKRRMVSTHKKGK